MAETRRKSPPKRRAQASSKLATYRSMRDFTVTREPTDSDVPAGNPEAADLSFVIQKHAATRLHYDFRLAWDGVLKSWAVAKGPSYFPGDKRLAVQVEDHPAEYSQFEGIIPKGEYGGGTVMVWDRGTWIPENDVSEGFQKGSLKFTLHGEKLRGKWALIRMSGRAANEAKPNWLLIKEHDAEERPADAIPITEEAPDSVLSGRTLQAIAQDGDKVWHSNRAPDGTSGQKREIQGARVGSAPKTANANARSLKDKLKLAPREEMPDFIAPQLASLGAKPPVGDRWVHEIKLDGYRIQIHVDRSRSISTTLWTRTGLDWTSRAKVIAESALTLPVQSAVIDGELVVLSSDGTTSFAALQAAFQGKSQDRFKYFAFDLLHLDGHNLRNLPLVERKELLSKLIAPNSAIIQFSEHIDGDSGKIFRSACELGSEGIISKLVSGAYVSGRGKSWIKSKCYLEQEFVVGGFTVPSNGTRGVGALLLGYYQGGVLEYAGRTGTGFTQVMQRDLRDRLDNIQRKSSPFRSVPRDVLRGVQWTNPELVAQVSFSNWTSDNLVRQASFKGLREDKSPKSVHREAPDAAASGRHVKSSGAQYVQGSPSHHSRAEHPGTLTIRLTHPDKIVDSSTGITKQMLAAYYQTVSDSMFPHIANRPLTLVRCVDGSDKPCFYQKHKNQMTGGSFDSVEVTDKKSGKPEPYITISQPGAIAELAQIAALELHPWGSCNSSLEQPDRITIDLDPHDSIRWETLANSAKEIRKRLASLQLKSFLKSTGGKGLHIVIPIQPEHPWDVVKQFAHSFVLGMEKDQPTLFLTKMTKAARTGKIYLDYLRNERGATAVAPYSPRARAGLPVAMPLRWSELKSEHPPRFSVSELSAWQSRLAHDPWKELPRLNQHLTI